jgi:hypothetical protein
MPPFRKCEIVLLIYFTYTAWCSAWFAVSGVNMAKAIALPLIILAGARIGGVVRDLVPVASLLTAYWQVEWFARPRDGSWEAAWVAWDRTLLDAWHGRAAIEWFGPLLPAMLEASYVLLYLIPPFSVAAMYGWQRQARFDAFAFPLVLSACLAYGLQPFFPSEPPRAVYPEADLPNYVSIFRRFNLGLLGKAGIHASVFPSGHVAVALGCAFGLLNALPERPWVHRLIFTIAGVVAVAIVYGRYHYAADAVSAMALSCVAYTVARRQA